MRILDMARRWLIAPMVIVAGLLTARIAFHDAAAPGSDRTNNRDATSGNAGLSVPAPDSLLESGSPQSEKPVEPAPEAPKSGEARNIAEADAALYRIHLLREKLARMNTLEELKRSGIPEQLETFFGESNFFATVDVLFEIVQTRKPWAYEYLAEVAQQETPDNPEGTKEENSRRSKWEQHTRRAALAALFSVNTSESQRTLKTLYENSLTDKSPLSAREVLNTAAEAGTVFSSALYLDAFHKADSDMRREWLSNAIPYNQPLVDDDVRMQILRETLANQDDAELSSQSVRNLLEERHLQYPGGAERATALLTDAFDARSPEGQRAMLLDIETAQDRWSTAGGDHAGNLQAIDTLLARGVNSEVESVRNTAIEIEQRLGNAVDADEVQRQIAEDMLWFQEVFNTLE